MKFEISKSETTEWKRRLKPLFRVIHRLLPQPEPARIRVQYRRIKS